MTRHERLVGRLHAALAHSAFALVRIAGHPGTLEELLEAAEGE